MRKLTFFTLLLTATSFIGCDNVAKPTTQSGIEKPAFDLETAKKEITEVNKQFMELIAKGDSAGLANLYTSDAKVLFTGAPAVSGRAGIQTVFGNFIKSGVTKVDLKTVDLFGTEDFLVEESAVLIYVKEQMVAEEKALVVYKKEDGKWKLFRDMTNANTPQH
ncbi:MAG: nuclear transport factor 2 family protein [Chitinophagaceae bacterium]|nr:MAG: nuclear transport factor 2 family protein [Chitinophagaceae bacterium]